MSVAQTACHAASPDSDDQPSVVIFQIKYETEELPSENATL